jgi:hypothetical protein
MRDSPHASARERNDGAQAVWEYTGLEKITVLGGEGAAFWKAQKSQATLADISKESSALRVVGALAESIVGRPATPVKKPGENGSWGSVAQWLAGRFNRSP